MIIRTRMKRYRTEYSLATVVGLFLIVYHSSLLQSYPPAGLVQAAKHNSQATPPPPPPPRPNEYFATERQQLSSERRNGTPPPPPSFDDERRYFEDSLQKEHDNYYPRQQDERRSSSASSRTPIHYEFTAKPSSNDGILMDDDADTINTDDVGATNKASPRQDLMARYMMESSTNRLKVHASATLVGCMMGVFLAKSLLPFGTTLWATLGGSFCWSSSLFLRTPLGELVRALGLSLLLVLERTRAIRKRYPTYRYVASLLQFGASSRRQPPFPPARNPWKYVPRRREDPDFNMMYALIAMVFVGSACGGSIPLLPTWMGSLAGATSFAVLCLQNSPRGDLGRTLGMRVVAVLQTLWEIQAQLGIIPKAAIVSSQIIDKCMVLDKQHKVKDRFLKVVNAGYHQVLAATEKATSSTTSNNEYEEDEPDRDEPDRDRRFRRRDGDERTTNSRRGGREDDRTTTTSTTRGEREYLDEEYDRGKNNNASDETRRSRGRRPPNDDEIEEASPPKKKGWFRR